MGVVVVMSVKKDGRENLIEKKLEKNWEKVTKRF